MYAVRLSVWGGDSGLTLGPTRLPLTPLQIPATPPQTPTTARGTPSPQQAPLSPLRVPRMSPQVSPARVAKSGSVSKIRVGSGSKGLGESLRRAQSQESGTALSDLDVTDATDMTATSDTGLADSADNADNDMGDTDTYCDTSVVTAVCPSPGDLDIVESLLSLASLRALSEGHAEGRDGYEKALQMQRVAYAAGEAITAYLVASLASPSPLTSLSCASHAPLTPLHSDPLLGGR